nr:hypothetical protein CFP56_75064 [Quercus suber]
MGTESCKTKDLEHNTGGTFKREIDDILMILLTSSEQYMMLQEVLRKSFKRIAGKKLSLEALKSNPLVSIQSKLPPVDIGEVNRPIWVPDKGSIYTS